MNLTNSNHSLGLVFFSLTLLPLKNSLMDNINVTNTSQSCQILRISPLQKQLSLRKIMF